MRGDRPAVAERVFELAVAIAPEHVLHRHRDLGAGLHRARGEAIHILDVQMDRDRRAAERLRRSEEHTSELQSLMRISYAVFCLKKKKHQNNTNNTNIYYKHKIATNKHQNKSKE